MESVRIFAQMPWELEEAAMIDGLCQIFRFLPSDDPCGKARPFCNSFVQFYEQLGRVHVCDDLY